MCLFVAAGQPIALPGGLQMGQHTRLDDVGKIQFQLTLTARSPMILRGVMVPALPPGLDRVAFPTAGDFLAAGGLNF